MSPRAKQLWTAFVAGALFGVGLAIAGMTSPRKVIGFLDFGGAWDPSLAFVMAGAVAVYAVTYRSIRHRSKPLFASSFSWPTPRRIEPKLVVGAAIFGIGWGIAGYCPGPAIASLGTGTGQALIFVAAMLGGWYAGKRLEERLFPSRAEPAPAPSA